MRKAFFISAMTMEMRMCTCMCACEAMPSCKISSPYVRCLPSGHLNGYGLNRETLQESPGYSFLGE